jgi:hypothetical protein
MRKRFSALVFAGFIGACGGGGDDDAPTASNSRPIVKICTVGLSVCTLTNTQSCPLLKGDGITPRDDVTCTVCDPNKPLLDC